MVEPNLFGNIEENTYIVEPRSVLELVDSGDVTNRYVGKVLFQDFKHAQDSSIYQNKNNRKRNVLDKV